MDMYTKKLIDLVKVKLQRTGETQSTLAERLEIDSTVLSKLLNGKRTLELEISMKLFEYLNINSDCLLDSDKKAIEGNAELEKVVQYIRNASPSLVNAIKVIMEANSSTLL